MDLDVARTSSTTGTSVFGHDDGGNMTGWSPRCAGDANGDRQYTRFEPTVGGTPQQAVDKRDYGNRFTFTGRELDAESGLMQYGTRH